MAAALIDRLLHHCHIVNIRGNSYRMREHRALASRLVAAPAPPPTSRPGSAGRGGGLTTAGLIPRPKVRNSSR